MNPWLIGGGAIAVLLLATQRASAAVMPTPGRSRDRDLDALADLLITETSFRLPKDEMAQIVWIAVNRSKRQNRPIWAVVAPGFAPLGSCPRTKTTRCLAWNPKGVIYRKRFENARSNPNWVAARTFAASVLAGSYRNRGFTAFVHPRAMPKPPCASNRVATSTRYGTRCLPTWIARGTDVGTARFA
jgi:hypothetical protein